MFVNRDENLPNHWRANPEIARTVMSMSCVLEIGKSQAMKFHARGYRAEDEEREIAELTDFLSKLQEKNEATLGEGSAGLR